MFLSAHIHAQPLQSLMLPDVDSMHTLLLVKKRYLALRQDQDEGQDQQRRGQNTSTNVTGSTVGGDENANNNNTRLKSDYSPPYIDNGYYQYVWQSVRGKFHHTSMLDEC